MARSITEKVLVSAAVSGLVACAGGEGVVPAGGDAGGGGAVPAVQVDTTEIVHGVRSDGRDPAVVALDLGGAGLCSGVLVAPDVVLTARHCVSFTDDAVDCPPAGRQIRADRDVTTVRVFVGDDLATARYVARGVELVVPASPYLCDADIAAIVLDEPVDGVDPLPLAELGVARGDHVRAVGFGRTGDGETATVGTKLVREHVRVLEATASEFQVGEATCQGDSGGPAIDEDTGAVAGVVSRGGPSCAGTDVHNVYSRVDQHRALVERALARAVARASSRPRGDAGAPPKRPAKPKPKKPSSDVGAACTAARDCAAGVCVTDAAARYCSRACGSGDRCPAGFHCKTPKAGASVCLRR